METRALGRSGVQVSALGLGTWAFGGRWRAGLGAADDDVSVTTIHRAVELGFTWIDTAPVYGHGHAEIVVGRALRSLPTSDRPLVFTKCGVVWDKHGDLRQVTSPASIRAEVHDSLARLRVSAIDVLQIHWPGEDGTPVEETWSEMASLRDEGKVRALGASNFNVQLLERCEAVQPVDVVQPPLNLIERQALADIVPWCCANEVGVAAYSPMAVGLLSGRFDRLAIENLPDDDFRREHGQFQEPAVARNLDLVCRLHQVSERVGRTLPQLAVGWVLSHPGVTGAIVGARHPDQLSPWTMGSPSLDEKSTDPIDEAVVASGAGEGPLR